MAIVNEPVNLTTIYKALWDNHLALSYTDTGERFVSPTYGYIQAGIVDLLDSDEQNVVNNYLSTWNLACNYFCFRTGLFYYLDNMITGSGDFTNYRVTTDGDLRETTDTDLRITT